MYTALAEISLVLSVRSFLPLTELIIAKRVMTSNTMTKLIKFAAKGHHRWFHRTNPYLPPGGRWLNCVPWGCQQVNFSANFVFFQNLRVSFLFWTHSQIEHKGSEPTKTKICSEMQSHHTHPLQLMLCSSSMRQNFGVQSTSRRSFFWTTISRFIANIPAKRPNKRNSRTYGTDHSGQLIGTVLSEMSREAKSPVLNYRQPINMERPLDTFSAQFCLFYSIKQH